MTAPLLITPEILVPRIGDVLVEKGVITQAQLEEGARQQKLLREQGQPLPFGQVLVSMGLISRKTLEEAITEQIVQLHAALREANDQLRQANEQLEQRVQQRTQELERALAKLAELNRLKANFVANISHELRTPLTHIKGYLDLLSAGDLGPINEEQQQALAVMNRSSERLERLIEDLILFSTADKGEITLNKHTFNLTNLCRAAVARSNSRASAKEIQLEMTNPVESVIVNADEEKIAWVILQLLDNAIKFTEKGGKVTLSVGISSGCAHLAVEDTGIGIPAERMGELFESFHQLDSSSTRRFGGTGLGLALVKKIVEAHQSTIHVSSTVGKGSKFEFLLQLG